MTMTATKISMTELIDWVRRSTKPYRKGEVVKEQDGVTTIDAFPQRPDLARVVDCGFITVGFTEAATEHDKQWLIDALIDNEQGEFVKLTLHEWDGGPSYIAIGGWIGDQTLAFLLMALGDLLGVWKVVTPAVFKIPEDDPAYQTLIGQGMVLVAPQGRLIDQLVTESVKGGE